MKFCEERSRAYAAPKKVRRARAAECGWPDKDNEKRLRESATVCGTRWRS